MNVVEKYLANVDFAKQNLASENLGILVGLAGENLASMNLANVENLAKENLIMQILVDLH